MSRTPPTLSVTESQKLLHEIEHNYGSRNRRIKGIRNRCMMLLMLDAGLRVGELVKLTRDALYFLNEARYYLTINAAFSKSVQGREVPISKRLRSAIEAMQVHWWSTAEHTPFTWAFTTWSVDTPLSVRHVERIVRDASLTSLGRAVHPHILRHTFASRLMRSVNVRIVQELLGHQHLTSTQIYTHPNRDDLEKAIATLDEQSPVTTVRELESLCGPDSTNRADAVTADRDVR